MRSWNILEVLNIERVRGAMRSTDGTPRVVSALGLFSLGEINQLMLLKYFEVLDTGALAAKVLL